MAATLRDGSTVEHFTPHAYGTKENPMSTDDVNAKVRRLLEPVLGERRTETVIVSVNDLENLDDVRELIPYLTVSAAEMKDITFMH